MQLPIAPLVQRWARSSQQGSRRNAMVATTELTRRRIERDDVEAYLATLARPGVPRLDAASEADSATALAR